MPRVSSRPPKPPVSTPKFSEVNAVHTDAAFRAYVAKGLAALRANETPVARATLEAISSGKVKLDELSDLTRPDFNRVRRDLAKDGVRLPPSDFERLHVRSSRAAKAVKASLNGYMWDDRIYLARGLSPEKLASTLVHEVNHLFNASEEHYRGDKAALREEYRAFYAEALFRGEKLTPAKCLALKRSVIALYGLKASPADVTDVPPGLLLP